MSNAFIELNRRFEEYRIDETPETQAQRSYMRAFLSQESGMTWEKLLQHRLVVILGEPGSGKTHELKAQQERQSTSSFFLELNRLVDEDVTNILDEEEHQRFSKWKKGGNEMTFFLDAVDESKIARDDDFFRALDRVRKAIGPAIRRSRFVISSRISEWRPHTDQGGVLQYLGLGRGRSERATQEEQRPPIGRNSPESQSITSKLTEAGEDPAAILTVTLLALTPNQVERYAIARGVQKPQEFMAALEENNAWAFASRPLDVSFLYTYWNDKGHLSNLTDLTENMVSNLLAEVPNKEKLDVLSPAQAREGAEYLAAAVILCHRLKFRVSDTSGIVGKNLLSPTNVLPESWLPKACRAMMDRALFDAASHGAMSFHHRYHTEYLAAAWFTHLMDNNCGVEALEDLLFAKVDGQRVLRPALKPVAAWLITMGNEPWRLRLVEWILESSPEIHLLHGDPSALPLDYRRKILNCLVKRYQGRNRVILNWDRPALARFASAGLTDELNLYLSDKSISEDLRADFLMVVREGKLIVSIPTVLKIFADSSTSDELRSYAVTVIRDIGDTNHRIQLAQLWQTLPVISNSLLAHLCEALFPRAVGVDGLLILLARCGEVHHNSIDLPYYLDALLRKELDASKAEELLKGLLELLSMSPLLDKPPLSKQFFWTTSLIPVCLRHLLSKSNLTSYACNELNGFPEWFSFLLSAHPGESAKALEDAVSGEWDYPVEIEHVYHVVATLSSMSDTAEIPTQVVMNRLLISDPLNSQILEYALTILIDSGKETRGGLLALAPSRVLYYTIEQAQWFNWLYILFQLDALPALDYLEGVLAELSLDNASDLVIRQCSVMSGRLGGQKRISNPSFFKPAALARFIPLVYRHVRVKEDIERANQGGYSPDDRDHAQEFRSRLLEELKNSIEPEADVVLRALLNEPTLKDSKDWILHLLDGRKSSRADDVAWEASDIRVFAREFCSEPRSDYQLFRLVSHLLENIKNDVEYSENAANRLPIGIGALEKDLRGFLCSNLSQQSLNWFTVTQESEVDLGERPDLHVDRASLNPIPIEIKLANLKHWSLPKLLERLENQLIGQYLRPANVRHGIYVLGNTNPKRRWELNGTKIDFTELIQHVQERAAVLQAKMRAGVDAIEVIGIDFSDPRER